MKKKILFWAIASLLPVAVLIIFLTQNNRTGHLKINVINAYTSLPVANATVVIPEIPASYTTDELGHVTIFNIPVMPNKSMDAILKSDCGEVTLLCYAEGYIPFVLFHTHVYENSVKSPTLYMFPDGMESGRTFAALIETPSDGWTEELLKKYEPR